MALGFPDYNYEEGFQRVENILNQSIDDDDKEDIPPDSEMTFSNGYRCWTSALFVDIRNSTDLFSEDEDMVSRIVRSFTSEIIEIMDTSSAAEVGIRGDCVYGIYSTPSKMDVDYVYRKAVHINTLINMLNKQYSKKGYPNIRVGIGLAIDKTFVIKAGRKGSGINSKVWIGNSVTEASNLSSYGSKNGIEPIVMSSDFFYNIKDIEVKNSYENNRFEDLFEYEDEAPDTFYHGNVINVSFDKWIQTK